MSYCIRCGKKVDIESATAYDSKGNALLRLWEPLICLCGDCISSGWRLDMCGDVDRHGGVIRLIQESNRPDVNLLDYLLTEEEN